MIIDPETGSHIIGSNPTDIPGDQPELYSAEQEMEQGGETQHEAPPAQGAIDPTPLIYRNYALEQYARDLENQLQPFMQMEQILAQNPGLQQQVVELFQNAVTPQQKAQATQEASNLISDEVSRQTGGADPNVLGYVRNLEQRLASIELNNQIGELKVQYGDLFDPRAAMTYAVQHNITDLRKAFQYQMGELWSQYYLWQRQAGAQTPQQQAPALVPDADTSNARVEPPRARQVPGVPQRRGEYRPRTMDEGANYALHLVQGGQY